MKKIFAMLIGLLISTSLFAFDGNPNTVIFDYRTEGFGFRLPAEYEDGEYYALIFWWDENFYGADTERKATLQLCVPDKDLSVGERNINLGKQKESLMLSYVRRFNFDTMGQFGECKLPCKVQIDNGGVITKIWTDDAAWVKFDCYWTKIITGHNCGLFLQF